MRRPVMLTAYGDTSTGGFMVVPYGGGWLWERPFRPFDQERDGLWMTEWMARACGLLTGGGR